MSTNTNDLQESAKSALRISDVYFRDSETKIRADIDPLFDRKQLDGAALAFQMRTELRQRLRVGALSNESGAVEEHDLVEYWFRGKLAGWSSREEADRSDGATEPLFQVDVVIGVVYELIDECPEDALQQFGKFNVTFNAMSYWREFVHSTCARHRLPSVTIPLFAHTVAAKKMREQNSAELPGESGNKTRPVG